MKTRLLNILADMNGLSHVRKNFLAHIFVLFISLRGRINFLNMARYGTYSEKTYRTHFETSFDFFAFNKRSIEQTCSGHRIIAGDCSFIPKSGKKTPHLGKFWNGCVSKALPGLEISSLAVVDIETNTAFHLECKQTPGNFPDEESRIDFYVNQVIARASELKELADYFVYDGAAGKKKFVDGIADHTDLHLMSKLRKDADLRYLYTGPQQEGPGRPKMYDGKINCKQIDTSRFDVCYEDDDQIIYTAIVNSKSFKRNIRIAYVQHKASGDYVILFSTDLSIDGYLLYTYYKARFQIEFLFRDGKQYTGLTHCQARSENKLSFHFNTSLTSVSFAKAEFYADTENLEKPFSMHDVNTVHFNTLFLDKIFAKLELDPTSEHLAPLYEELLNIGKIAA
ncbi:MAG: transposase [Deltaproteobacteria bacterium]|nr:transposase [Deltaproteobacteria bacterium]